MPQNTRALTRAARDRAHRMGEKYTEARTAVIEIRELADENDWTVEEAEAFYDDPRNQVMCDTCGWTWGMGCPECVPGCGCNNGRCSGWRHREYRHEDDDADLDGDEVCECGASHEYGCVCE